MKGFVSSLTLQYGLLDFQGEHTWHVCVAQDAELAAEWASPSASVAGWGHPGWKWQR